MRCVSAQAANIGFLCLLVALVAGPLALVARAIAHKNGADVRLTWIIRFSTAAMMIGVSAGLAAMILSRRC